MLLALLLLLQDEVKVVDRGKLESALQMPVAFAPDGKSILYFKRDGAKFVYALAGADGKPIRDVYTTAVDWDDMLNSTVGPSSFSADGKRVAALATKDDKGFRTERDRLRAAVCGEKVEKIDAEQDALSCAFAGDKLLFIDGELVPNGFKLKLQDGAVLHESATGLAFCLRASPDGARAAFLVAVDKKNCVLRVVDLKSKAVVDSEEFRSDDVTFDGPPLFYWDAEGKSLFAHRTPDAGGKKPFTLVRFDIASKKTEAVAEDVAVTAALDKDHLAVIVEKRGGVLRLSDRKTFLLPEGLIIMGGAGRRVVVGDMKTHELRVVELEVPK